MAHGPGQRCDLVLTGGTVVTMDEDRRVIDPGSVAIAGDRILAVGSVRDVSTFDPARTIDCRDAVVLPGLIDCHTHLFDSMERGLGEGLTLWPWLSTFRFPFLASMEEEDVRIAALLGAVESLKAGTTAVLDHHYWHADVDGTLAVAETVENAGLRGVLARGIAGGATDVAGSLGLPGIGFPPDEEIEITRACMEGRPPGSRLAVWPAPLNILHTSHDLFRRSVGLARDLGSRWHTHCSETRDDPEIFLEAFGVRPIRWLEDEGLLGPDTTLAHAVWLDDEEIDLLSGRGAAVSHNPVSNQYLASGAFRLRATRDAGVIVGLGTDGVSCGHRLDMLEVVKQTVLLQRVTTMDPTVTTAQEALELATREGARLLGIDAGVLAPGKLADVVVVPMTQPHLTPHPDPVSALAYSARGSDVEVTIVGGRVVVEGGRAVLVDEDALMREANERAAAVLARMGQSD